MSKRYDQMPDFSDYINRNQLHHVIEPFAFSRTQKQQVNNLLKENGFSNFYADDLLSYINRAIVGREHGKFVFTRTVSDILEKIAKYAEANGLSRDEISHVPLSAILNSLKNYSDINVEEYLREIFEQESDKHDISVAIRLPQLLVDEAGVNIVPFQVSHPNFITQKKIIAQCLLLNSDIDDLSLKGKVIIIEGADPGYDWIFSQEISGLITKYGGANSHMAIRCAEFGIPAAIGCGEQRFEQLIKADYVHLDCAAGLVIKAK